MVFNPVTGESFSLNPVGLSVISMIQKGYTIVEIVDSLLKEYKTDRATLEKDIQDFIYQIEQYHLLDKDEKKA